MGGQPTSSGPSVGGYRVPGPTTLRGRVKWGGVVCEDAILWSATGLVAVTPERLVYVVTIRRCNNFKIFRLEIPERLGF